MKHKNNHNIVIWEVPWMLRIQQIILKMQIKEPPHMLNQNVIYKLVKTMELRKKKRFINKP